SAVTRAFGAGPDVQVKAILGTGRLARRCRRCRLGRGRRRACSSSTIAAAASGGGTGGARCTKGIGLSHAVPLGGGLRGAPAIFPNGRGGERNAFEHPDGR